MGRLRDLRNIGATLERQLHAVGVFSGEQLRSRGPGPVYVDLCNRAGRRLPVCYYLFSLAAALEDRDWRELSEQEKGRLLRTCMPAGMDSELNPAC